MLVFLIAAILLAFPVVADACPLCQGGGGSSQKTIIAYKNTTLFLALLPLVTCGGIFYWIYRRYKRYDS
jgi:hypothetical protein